MRLTSQALINFSTINDFQNASQWTIRASDPNTLYYQLFDLDNVSQPPYVPMNSGFFNAAIMTSPQRYIAGVGSSNQPFSMTVTFPSLDPTRTFTFTGTQNAYDGSVWSITLPGYAISAVAPASGNVVFSLTQGIQTWTWTVTNMIAVEMTNAGCC